jgi:hypothetical protein
VTGEPLDELERQDESAVLERVAAVVDPGDPEGPPVDVEAVARA